MGHVEWIWFGTVDRIPLAGEIAHSTDDWEDPGGGGAVAAVQLRKLAGACDFFTALGRDALGERAADELAELGVDVHAGRETSRPDARSRSSIPRASARSRRWDIGSPRRSMTRCHGTGSTGPMPST